MPELSAAQRARLAAWRREGAAAAAAAIPRTPEGVPAPLSFAQQRLWFLARMAPESGIYQIYRSARLGGPLDLPALAWSLREIVRRHAVLRTTIGLAGDEPVQVVHDEPGPHLHLVSLETLPRARREAAALQLAAEEAARPFDLERGPLLRVLLLRLGRQDHALLLTIHHVVFDGASMGVLLRELAALYAARRAGAAVSPLAEPPIQYADWARWQRRQLDGDAIETLLAWWREQLAGELPVLELPADHPRTAAPSLRGARHAFALPPRLAVRLRELAAGERVTLFMLLLAAFQTLLHRWTGQQDLLVGTPIANRSRPELRDLMGLFVNTLVLRTDLSGEPSWRELLGRTRRTALGAYAHQDLPFERLVEELQPARDLAHTPLFQVLFVLDNATTPPVELAGVAASSLDVAPRSAPFELTLSLADGPDGVGGWFDYQRDLFEPATIGRLAGHLETLLAGAAEDPGRRLSELPLLSAAERLQLLVEWNGPRRRWKETFVHLLVAEWAARTPDAPALAAPGEVLPYGELDLRARRLAGVLRSRGVGPDTLVGIVLDRSPAAVVAILGVLAAGAAYVPLDAALPAERLAALLAEIGATLVLAEVRLRGRIPAGRYEVLAVDGTDLPSSEAPAGSPPPLAAEHLAYAIYTSGSTGRPKAVMVSHGALLNLTLAFRETFSLGPGDRLLLLPALTFDASIGTLFASLAGGACVVLHPDPAQLAGRALERFCAEQGVTAIDMPAAAWSQWVEDLTAAGVGRSELLPRLAKIVSGGESVSRERVRAWNELTGGRASFWGAYGPTEATICTTLERAVQEPDGAAPGGGLSTLPLGRPLPNVEVYLLDRHLRLVPAGVPGELCAGGAGVARGYLARPEATAERFVPNPFGAPGARMYRTGDLARWLPDGRLEFLGRLDRQVKIRGFRIEPAEVEALLLAQPEVRGAAVVAREDRPGDRRLVGYVVWEGEGGFPAAELRAALARQLPAYMVPAAFVRLTALPLTPHGKLDRAALPAPAETAEEGPITPPRSATERELAVLWRQLLGRERVGVDDDFFTLGGHSLLAMQLVSRIRERFGVEPPLRVVFESRTLAAQAATLDDLRDGEAGQTRRGELEPAALPIPRRAAAGPAPLSPGQERLWFLQQLLPETPAYHINAAFRLTGRLDAGSLEEALNDLVHRHDALRTVFTEEEGRPLQVVRSAARLALATSDLRDLPAGEREAAAARLASAAVEAPFDLTAGPPLRVLLLRLGRDEHVLVLAVHHIVVDGWSMGVLFRELSACYAARVARRPPALPPLTLQFGDYAAWQRRRLQGARRGELVAHWRRRLAGAAPVLEVPADRPRPAVQSYRGGAEELALPAPLVEDLRRLGRGGGITPFMVLLAGFKALLARHSGSTDVLVGTPAAGRDRRELEPLVGYFVSTLVLRSDLGGDPSFAGIVERVRETTLDAFAHAEIPFEELLDELEVARDLSRSPIFQHMFVFQTAVAPPPALPGLAVEYVPVRRTSAKFDLQLFMEETADGVLGALEYNADLFDGATALRLIGHLQTLLAAAAEDPGRRLSELPLLTSAERRMLLLEWNDTTTDYPLEGALHHWIEARAAVQPDALAVDYAGERLSYRELDRRANQLARHLAAAGVEPDGRVAVCLERSLELVVALLAVLKAGAAYVPLEPEQPRERLAAMLEDARPDVLLTVAALRPRLPEGCGPVLCLDREEAALERTSSAPLAVAVHPEQAAYVIFTSGSTGRPKGVVVPHRGICNRLLWMQEAYRLTPADRVLQKTPFGFDVSVWEFFWPLMTGAGLIVARPGGHRDGAYLVDLVARAEITTLHFVPSMLQVFLEEPELARCRSLLRVVCSGEALPPALAERFFERLPGVELHNLYGPTEASVDVTAWACAPGSGGDTVPIGRPIANTQIHLLDADFEPVPVGVPGELYIGGVGLARGYLGRPELTASSFTPSPFARNGERLYRTGDLARRRADGAIEFLGRRDHQVKLRGLRIELGEIETALAQLAGVREAVVLAREDRPGDRRLVAYLVAGGGPPPAVEPMRARLRELLPEYMVPAAFVVLDALPLTANGKVDRRALPAPDSGRPELAAPFVPPRTHGEEVLAAVWAQVLGIETVGARDNFFTLGGDSIRSLRVLALARERGLHLTLPQLFQYQTVRELAARAEGDGTARAPRTVPFELVGAADRRRLPAGIEDAYPLTRLQAGMLFHGEYAAGSVVYHDAFSLRLRARFDPEALRESLRRLAARHPVLRTAFDLARYREPLQLVHARVAPELAVEDLGGLDEAAQEAAVAAWIESERALPFDLARPPLWRYAAHLRGDEEFQLTLGFHHAILDGWSVATLTTELLQLYATLLAGGADPLPPPPAVAFRDYVALELAARADADAAAWRERLRGAERTLLPQLAADAPGRRRVRVHEVEIGEEVAAGLARLAAAAAVPVKSVLLAAHLRVLGVLSGQAEVLAGVIANGRPEEAGGDRVLGLFLNALPVRLGVAEGSWRELAQATFAAERELLPHRRYPMAELQKALGGEPLFETTFNYVHFHVYDELRELPGLAVLDSSFHEDTNFPLVANFSLAPPDGRRLRLGLAYDPARFGEAQARDMGDVYARALAAMAAAPDGACAEAPLLPAAQAAALAAWNGTARPYVLDRCLHELIEEQADRTPEATAVVCGGEALSYRELDARANQLAHHLRRLGVGTESRVALCVERSLELIVGLLAVLKAGAAYVPLDPDYPRERLVFMLEDSAAALLLTQERLAAQVPVPAELPVVRLDADREAVARVPRDRPRVPADPAQLAYVIYTSGSTGRPKGAMLHHRGVVNRLLWMQEAYGLGPADRVLQKTPASFDVSVWEFFWPLLTGACLVLARPEGHRDPGYLVDLIAAEGITTLHFVPSMLRPFLEEPGVERCRGLRRVICSGEALSPALVQSFFERLGTTGAVLHNLYGPTEASVDVTAWRCAPDGAGPVPIGRPIANTAIHVLDRHLLAAPVGSPGELFIGGVGVGRGYFGRPELTAERFVPDPFGGAGERLYRTGDLARWLPEGSVEYLGRLDHQVKVRGFRIELGEIETALALHPALGDVVVTARDDAPGEPRLVAYLVAADGVPAPEELRAFLRERLPEHMLPSAFVRLERLPLLPNGKIDRRALPAPDFARPVLRQTYTAPRTETERELAEIWSRVLGLEPVGVDDDFFALGGDSILSIRVSALARERGLDVRLPELFARRTVRELARAVEPAADDPARLIARLDQLPEEEVDALLAGLLEHKETTP